MATAPGQQFADWTQVPGIMDAFNQAKNGNPSAGSMALGYAINSLAPKSDIGKKFMGGVQPIAPISPVAPPGVAQNTQGAIQQPTSTIPNAYPDQNTQPSLTDSFTNSFNQNHELLSGVLKLVGM